MSTEQYTPDELEFIDKAMIAAMSGLLADPNMTDGIAGIARRNAEKLLDERRRIRGTVQPDPAAPIANNELAVHEPVCTEDMIRGMFFWECGLTDTHGGIQVEYNSNEGIGMNQLHEKLKLNQGDVIEIRVIERADR